MNFKPQANLFLTVYFAFLAGHVHLATIVHWRNLAQPSLDWRLLSLLMTCFWGSHFLVALFPKSLLLRIFSCLSLFFVWKETSAFHNWSQLLYFYVHLVVTLAPELTLQSLYKLKFFITDQRAAKLIGFGLLGASIFYLLKYTNFHIHIEWLYLLMSVLAVFLMVADAKKEVP
jgi:hypothetical protein